MANSNSPFGFMQYYGGAGGAPTFAQSTYRIGSANSTAIYCGDAVVPVTGTPTGLITQATASTVVIVGIFMGCKYLSASQKRTVWSRYWPGADATGDVEAYVIDDPNARFVVMGGGTTFNATGTLSAMTVSPIGQYAQLNVGTGSTATGQSGMYIDAKGTTVTYPFIVTGLITDPPGAVGSDPFTAYNWVVVGFNNQINRTNGAGPTGIS